MGEVDVAPSPLTYHLLHFLDFELRARSCFIWFGSPAPDTVSGT